jgi:AcrR family transcriptional regulator
MTQLTWQERQRQLREEAILDATQALMAEQGYSQMSMDDVAARLGVSKATLYQHFPSKEELVINVIVRSMRRGEEFIQQQDPSLPALVRLERVMRNALEHQAELWTARIMLPAASVPLHPLFQAQAQRLNLALTQLVDTAKAEGDIAPHLSTAVIVLMLRGIMREGSHGTLLANNEYSIAELRDTLIEILFNGIRAKPPTDANVDT